MNKEQLAPIRQVIEKNAETHKFALFHVINLERDNGVYVLIYKNNIEEPDPLSLIFTVGKTCILHKKKDTGSLLNSLITVTDLCYMFSRAKEEGSPISLKQSAPVKEFSVNGSNITVYPCLNLDNFEKISNDIIQTADHYAELEAFRDAFEDISFHAAADDDIVKH